MVLSVFCIFATYISLFQNPDVPFEQGGAYFKAGDYEQAVFAYDKAIEMEPRFSDAYLKRAWAYFYLHRYDEAWEDVRKTATLREGSSIQDHPGVRELIEELNKVSKEK